MPIDLNNKVVLITGASSGFGRDAAHLFAARGARVVLAARRLDRLQALAEEIQNKGGEALAVPVDVTQRAEVDLMAQTVMEVYEQVDILFNNAGFGRLDWLEKLDPGRDIETQIQVNLVGMIQVTRAVLPFMLQRQEGHIINMSSVAGRIAAPTYTVYAASKFGVRGFTDALRREVTPFGIQVSGIYPGPAHTEFGWGVGHRMQKRLHPFKRIFMPSKKVAQRVVELARRPRRSVVIPWWFAPVIWGENTFPGIADWLIRTYFTDHYHSPEDE
ncbi:MAG: SDR family NAD(P)-dependent oxidoreductase [Chloroflexota bacterium]